MYTHLQGGGSGVEDWRGELLQAVERILDHEHSLLASTMKGGREGQAEGGEEQADGGEEQADGGEEQADGGEDKYHELLQQQVRVR